MSDETVRLGLESGERAGDLTLRVPAGHRDTLMEDLGDVGLESTRVSGLPAGSAREALSVTVDVPRGSGDALARALTEWSTRHAATHVEFELDDGRRLTVKSDRRAMRRAFEDDLLPHVRDQQADRQDDTDEDTDDDSDDDS